MDSNDPRENPDYSVIRFLQRANYVRVEEIFSARHD